ncbi:MAG: HigA family addiction module antitoxin [Nitrosospira sp.]|nr:HigA family addiction module antitoxin [Nitrosospira sp.]
MPMHNPPHPGGLIRREIINPLNLSVSNAADILGVSRQTVSLLLNERTDLSPQMALRIEKAFGPKMDHLMRMQLAYDVAKQRAQGKKIHVKSGTNPRESCVAGQGNSPSRRLLCLLFVWDRPMSTIQAQSDCCCG